MKKTLLIEEKSCSVHQKVRKGEAIGIYNGNVVTAPFNGVITKFVYPQKDTPASVTIRRTMPTFGTKTILIDDSQPASSVTSKVTKGQALGMFEGKVVTAPFNGVVIGKAFGNNYADSITIKRTIA